MVIARTGVSSWILQPWSKELERASQEAPWSKELRASQRAELLGFANNDEAFTHPLNVDKDAAEHDDGLDPALDEALKQEVLKAEQEVAMYGLKDCPYKDVSTSMSFADFLHARHKGEVHDPLQIFHVHTPSMSDYPDFAALQLGVKRALTLEWAAGPERPLAFARCELGSSLLAYHHSLPYLLQNRSPPPCFSGNSALSADRLMGLVRGIGKNTGGWAAVDRTGTLSSGLRVRNLFPLPRFDPDFKLTLEEVMSLRVKELLARHRRLHILWSGGIDTTAIVVAFFRAVGCDRESWERHGLSVHYGSRSLKEHPDFFRRYIAHLPGGVIDCSLRSFIDGSRVVVAGTPADQLFSTAWFRRAFTVPSWKRPDGKNVSNSMWYGLDRPWEEAMPEVLRNQGCLSHSKEDEQAWLDWVRPWVAKSPVPVKDVFDFGWWVSFSLKWQYDCLRVFLNREVCSEALLQSVQHFYASDDFQKWMYINHASRMLDRGVYSSFKEPLKRYIREYDGDQEYYRVKCKVASVCMQFGYQLGLTDSYHIIRCGLLSVSRQRMIEKYGNALQRFVIEPDETSDP